ncbi:hypothetical protein HYDPIDRAFT_110230 [Hydnomerulius pinastri MD-312]|nr:hypothetical protein HYDPIDRAFT_110230 [Hydnomerulius pinastri MD-312]
MPSADAGFPFSQLSIELALHIIHFAAIPDFSCRRVDNPYAGALALCSVSKAVRRATLPSFLHTVFLTEGDCVAKFINALRIQKRFAVTKPQLFVDYTTYVRRIWVGHYADPPPPAPTAFGFFDTSSPRVSKYDMESDIDISLLAPVLLGAPSLGINFQNIMLLCNCLDWAWRNQTSTSGEDSMDVDASISPTLPWRTSTLTLTGDLSRWRPLTSNPEGTAFLAFLSSLFLLPDRVTIGALNIADRGFVETRGHAIPALENPMEVYSTIPWSSFSHLQSVALPLKYNLTPSTAGKRCFQTPLIGGKPIYASVLSMSAPSDSTGMSTKKWVDDAMDAYLKEDEGCLAIVEIEVEIGDRVYFDWETCWRNGLVG